MALIEAVRACLVSVDETRPAQLAIARNAVGYEVRFDFAGSFAGTISIAAPGELALTYVVSDMHDRPETARFCRVEDLKRFLGRMIRVIRHYSLPNLHHLAC